MVKTTLKGKASQRVLLDNLSKAREELRKADEAARSHKVQAVKNAGQFLPPKIHSYRNKQGKLTRVIACFRADQPDNPYRALKVSARMVLELSKHDPKHVIALAQAIITAGAGNDGDTDE